MKVKHYFVSFIPRSEERWNLSSDLQFLPRGREKRDLRTNENWAELWRLRKIIPTFLNPQQSLDNRYRLLCKQREDAKDLKDNLDRRERVVSTFLSRQLTDTQLQEYRRFIQTKASLLIRQKDLDEKQRLGEEQLEAVLGSIPPWNRKVPFQHGPYSLRDTVSFGLELTVESFI